MRHVLCSILALALIATGSLRAQKVSYPEALGTRLTNTFPYSMIGQLIFTSGDSDFQGTGTVVFRRSVVTAAHNLWDADFGWSTDIEFNRARNGSTIARKAWATRLFIFGGYQNAVIRNGADSARAFASDLGGLRFTTLVAGGSYAGWRADTSLLTGNSYNIALGYGADFHSGDDLLYVEPGYSFYRTYGAFLENDSLTFEGGMSGGPIFAELTNGELRIVGVIVAGSDDPPSGGIRALDVNAARFLNTYLRY